MATRIDDFVSRHPWLMGWLAAGVVLTGLRLVLGGLEHLLQALLASLHAHVGRDGRLEDDLTLVLVEHGFPNEPQT